MSALSGMVALDSGVYPSNDDASSTVSVARAAGFDNAASRSYARESLGSTAAAVDRGSWALGSGESTLGKNLMSQASIQDQKIARQKVYEEYGKTYESIIAAAKKSHSAELASTGYAYIEKVPLSLTHEIAMDSYDNAKRPNGFDANHATGDVGNAYSFSQCTWWAYVRRHQLGLPAGSHMGDGRMWGSTGKTLGYWVDNTPMVGDAMSFPAGAAGSDGYYGHVAIVEYVSPIDGTVVTSESGASLNGDYTSRVFTKEEAIKYLYVHL